MKRECPFISMDYTGMVDEGPGVDENPTIVLTDRKSKAKMAHALPKRVPTHMLLEG